jgi:hypothetical protein
MPVIHLPDPVWEFPIDDGLVLARPGVQGLFLLNQSAAIVWRLLREQPDSECATRRFAAHYGIPGDLAARDVNATLESWSSTLLHPTDIIQGAEPNPKNLAIAPLPIAEPYSVADYRLHQKLFRIAAHDADLSSEFAPRLQPLRVESGSPDLEVHIFRHDGLVHAICDHKSLVAEPNANAARAVLLPELVRLADPSRDWLAILHAGACALQSKCILFPASSHSGKTTLMAALMHSGFHFLSDDSAAIDVKRSK